MCELLKQLFLCQFFFFIIYKQTIPHKSVHPLLLENSLVIDVNLWAQKLQSLLIDHLLKQVILNLNIEVVNMSDLRLTLYRQPHWVDASFCEEVPNVLLDWLVTVVPVDLWMVGDTYCERCCFFLYYDPLFRLWLILYIKFYLLCWWLAYLLFWHLDVVGFIKVKFSCIRKEIYINKCVAIVFSFIIL